MKLMDPSIYLTYDGTFHSAVMNGLGAPMKLTHLEVRYEGEYHNEYVEGKRCIIQEPIIGSDFEPGEVFEVMAYCPTINKDAKYASLHINFEYTYTHPTDNKNRTGKEDETICLLNEGDEFSY